jgi:hypothetical protein
MTKSIPLLIGSTAFAVLPESGPLQISGFVLTQTTMPIDPTIRQSLAGDVRWPTRFECLKSIPSQ